MQSLPTLAGNQADPFHGPVFLFLRAVGLVKLESYGRFGVSHLVGQLDAHLGETLVEDWDEGGLVLGLEHGS